MQKSGVIMIIDYPYEAITIMSDICGRFATALWTMDLQ